MHGVHLACLVLIFRKNNIIFSDGRFGIVRVCGRVRFILSDMIFEWNNKLLL